MDLNELDEFVRVVAERLSLERGHCPKCSDYKWLATDECDGEKTQARCTSCGQALVWNEKRCTWGKE